MTEKPAKTQRSAAGSYLKRCIPANVLFRFETSCALNGKNERVLSPQSSTGRRATVHLEEAYVIA